MSSIRLCRRSPYAARDTHQLNNYRRREREGRQQGINSGRSTQGLVIKKTHGKAATKQSVSLRFLSVTFGPELWKKNIKC